MHWRVNRVDRLLPPADLRAWPRRGVFHVPVMYIRCWPRPTLHSYCHCISLFLCVCSLLAYREQRRGPSFCRSGLQRQWLNIDPGEATFINHRLGVVFNKVQEIITNRITVGKYGLWMLLALGTCLTLCPVFSRFAFRRILFLSFCSNSRSEVTRPFPDCQLTRPGGSWPILINNLRRTVAVFVLWIYVTRFPPKFTALTSLLTHCPYLNPNSCTLPHYPYRWIHISRTIP